MNDRISRVKNGKFFIKRDILLYAVILIAVIAAVTVLILAQDKGELEKIEIYYDKILIYVYDNSLKNGIITEAGRKYVTEKSEGNELRVVVTVPEGYNVIVFDGEGAKVTEADCSVRADCVNFSGKITKSGDAIFCVPHSLSVVGVGTEGEEVLL